MTEKNSRKNETVDALFDAILSLESREECYAFFVGSVHSKGDLRYGTTAGSGKAAAWRLHL